MQHHTLHHSCSKVTLLFTDLKTFCTLQKGVHLNVSLTENIVWKISLPCSWEIFHFFLLRSPWNVWTLLFFFLYWNSYLSFCHCYLLYASKLINCQQTDCVYVHSPLVCTWNDISVEIIDNVSWFSGLDHTEALAAHWPTKRCKIEKESVLLIYFIFDIFFIIIFIFV